MSLFQKFVSFFKKRYKKKREKTCFMLMRMDRELLLEQCKQSDAQNADDDGQAAQLLKRHTKYAAAGRA